MRVVLVGALFGAVAVGLGAVGAHLLDDRLAVDSAGTFRTAVDVMGLHAVAMVALGALKDQVLPGLLGLASWAFALGVLLFSGSLLALSLTEAQLLAFAAPVGGGLLIVGWLLVAVAAARRL